MSKLEPLFLGKALKILRMLFDRASFAFSYVVNIDQVTLAKELKITRQALNIHLRKLKSLGLIRTGRGFIEITAKGIKALGFSENIAIVFVKVSPSKRPKVYQMVSKLPVWQAYRVAGEMDLALLIEADKLDEVLKEISGVEGVEQTLSYITIEPLRIAYAAPRGKA
ncbi:MAG: Lrp/AsnC family transcriptional regulator [Candidatus Hecatellaceae archaeon]